LTALRIFEEWKERLAEAVGAQPSEMVEGMAARLRRRGWESANPKDSPGVRTDHWRDRPFVGRAHDYQLLYEAWERTRRGEASHALVLGDSGVGKTTLVDRLTTAAGLEGAVSTRAQCYDLEQEIPYATLSNLVQGLLNSPGVSGTPPEALAELALTIKEVRLRFPAIPVAQESHGETARLRLAEAVHQMLETIVEERPVIIIVDDLHLCDEASLAVLHLIAHRVRKRPVMLVFVARAGDLPRSPRAHQLRTNAPSLELLEIDLAPLSRDDSGELLSKLLPSSFPGADSSLRRAIIRAAGGYPMILELLIQDWKSHGEQALALSLDAMTVEFGTATGALSIYGRVFDRLFFALDQCTRQVLSVAAILGHRLNDLSLYSLADLGQGQVMAAMADLVRTRVLRDAGRGLEFVNEVVRAAAYLEVPSPVRRFLHSGIAEHLMDEERRGVPFLSLEIAWHATRAGNVATMPSFLFRGAHEAIAQGALDAAVRALGTALPQLAHDDQVAASLLLAEVLQEQGRWAESTRVLVDCPDALGSSMGTVLSIFAEHRAIASDAESLARDLNQLSAKVQSDPCQRVRLKAANAAAQMVGDTRNQELARQLAYAAESIRREELPADERDQLDLCSAQLRYYAGQEEAVRSELTRLAASLHAKGAINSTLVRVHSGMGVICCRDGDYDLAEKEFHKAHVMAVRIGNEPQQVFLAANLALCSLRLGRLDDLEQWSSMASLAGYSLFQRLQAAYYQATVLALRGSVAAALQVFAMLDGSMPNDVPTWLLQAWRLLHADILWLCGHQADAIEMARKGIGGATPGLLTPAFAGAYARWVALVAESQGDLRGARDILEVLVRRYDSFDAMDRAEITCARLVVVQGGIESANLQLTLTESLARLPSPVATQLRRLGILRVSGLALETGRHEGEAPPQGRPC
jgi:tetratricopeptide (TPR) repeat protein